MKANFAARLRLTPRTALTLVAAAAVSLTAACVQPRAPVPAPSPTPAPVARPAPPPPPVAAVDWRDAPITPGDWRWGIEAGQSVARFADGALVLRCDPARRTVLLQRPGAAQGDVAIRVTTSATSRLLTASAQAAPHPMLAAPLAPGDALLDALAFSRGRFAIETAGLPTLYVPSWPEVSRVVEDCR